MSADKINYEDLAKYLCGDESEETKKAYADYCEEYDEAHMVKDREI